jgi:hypothetical protein
VRCHRHLRSRLQLGQQDLSLGTHQVLTALVQPPRAFLKRVVALKDGTQRHDDRWRRGWHQQGRQRAVIESNLRRQGEDLTTSHALSGRELDLFLRADMLEESGSELGIGGSIDRASLRHHTLEKPVETGMITRQKAVDSSSHERSLPRDYRGRDAVMGKALNLRGQPIWICPCVQQMGVFLPPRRCARPSPRGGTPNAR